MFDSVFCYLIVDRIKVERRKKRVKERTKEKLRIWRISVNMLENASRRVTYKDKKERKWKCEREREGERHI